MNWSILQTGVGIELDGDTLRAVCVKRAWKSLRIVDRLEISEYENLGPQECGRRYRDFLKRNGLKAPWTVLALPRSSVLLRSLHFPKLADAELARAVEYQLDSLHPFEESNVYWAFSRSRANQPAAGKQERIEVLVAIAEKATVERIAGWLDGAGIGVSQFTVTIAALVSALQPKLAAGDQPLFVVNAGKQAIEIAGYAPGAGCVSRQITAQIAAEVMPNVSRELAVVRSELRLNPEARIPLVLCGGNLAEAATDFEDGFSVLRIDQVFSLRLGNQAEDSVGPYSVAFAAAAGAADRTLPFSINLLPAERRTYSSSMVYLPTYGLSALTVILALGLGLRGTLQDWTYNRYLEQQIQSLSPQMQAVDAAQSQAKEIYERLAALSAVRRNAALPLEILDELTAILPGDVWLQQLSYDGETVSLIGTGKSSAQLLQTLAESNHFENPQFLSAISRTADGKETFRIGVRVKKVR